MGGFCGVDSHSRSFPTEAIANEAVSIPPFAKIAKDGAPVESRPIEKNKTRGLVEGLATKRNVKR